MLRLRKYRRCVLPPVPILRHVFNEKSVFPVVGQPPGEFPVNQAGDLAILDQDVMLREIAVREHDAVVRPHARPKGLPGRGRCQAVHVSQEPVVQRRFVFERGPFGVVVPPEVAGRCVAAAADEVWRGHEDA